LLTGPAGSGKTTTIYACLRHLAEAGGRHIITIEDPVEQIVPGTMQTEINEAIGLDFARAARHLLRQDPQVLIIGEIRDEATAQLAVRAGLTGHLVISTLHAGSCRGVFERLLLDVYRPFRRGERGGTGLEPAADPQSLQCRVTALVARSCLHTGYAGRLPLVEWLRVDETLRESNPPARVVRAGRGANARSLGAFAGEPGCDERGGIQTGFWIMKTDEFAFFNQQLAAMLRDGIPLEGALATALPGNAPRHLAR
jgi:type II secretory ATPase GspE/PulE/Tfp pilus assembly ATPase PilB-like protein